GEPLNVETPDQRSQTCPVCAWSSAEQAIQAEPRKRKAVPSPVTSREPSPRAAGGEAGYRVAPGQGRECPRCGQWLQEEAVLCVECGFGLETGEKLEREFQPVRGHWEWGLSLPARWRLFAGIQGFLLVLGVTLSVVDEDMCLSALVAWLV